MQYEMEQISLQPGLQGPILFQSPHQTYRYRLFRIRVSGELGTLWPERWLFDAIAIIICLRGSAIVALGKRNRRMVMRRFFRHRMSGFAVGTTHI